MAKQSLHGYWTSKEDPNVYIVVDKVYKKGYVTGFRYEKIPVQDGYGEVASQLRITQEELLSNYEKGLRRTSDGN